MDIANDRLRCVNGIGAWTAGLRHQAVLTEKYREPPKRRQPPPEPFTVELRVVRDAPMSDDTPLEVVLCLTELAPSRHPEPERLHAAARMPRFIAANLWRRTLFMAVLQIELH